MVFHSYKFILAFWPVLLLCYRLAQFAKGGTRESVRLVLLLVSSVLFLVPFGLSCVLSVFCSIAVNGFAAWVFPRTDRKPARRILFASVLVLNIAVLVCLKLSAFPLPVGLSFYTFTQIAFLADVYRGEISSFTLPEYLLHVLFFPKFLQGPIMRLTDTRTMITSRLQDDMRARNLLNGALLFSLGLFKKNMVADVLGNCVDTAYGLIPHLTRGDAVLTILVFVAQLYFDFSAYCDMGRGCAWMMGLDLPDNFLQPLKTEHIVAYWKKWHMSLTGFFTRYLYIPLGGSRKGNLRRYLHIMIVFLVSGFWHGSGVTFLVWGALHGAAYVLVTALLPVRTETEGNGVLHRAASVFKTACNYVFVSICYVFFRAPNLADAVQLFSRVTDAAHFRVSETIADAFYLDEIWYVVKVLPLSDWEYRTYLCMAAVLLVSIVLLFFVPDAKALVLRHDKYLQEGMRVRSVLFVLLCAALFVWALVSTGEVATYLYVNF